MLRQYRKFNEDLMSGVVGLVFETGKRSRRWPGTSGSTSARS